MRENTCCFTGHRALPADGEAAIRQKIREAVLARMEEGYTDFMVGGARGFDMLAAEVLLDLREKEGKSLRLISVLPHRSWRNGWPAADAAREERILRNSGEVSYSEEKPGRPAYYDRNRKMVDGSSVCIAYCTRPNAGTAYTIRYALQQGVRVINLAEG